MMCSQYIHIVLEEAGNFYSLVATIMGLDKDLFSGLQISVSHSIILSQRDKGLLSLLST